MLALADLTPALRSLSPRAIREYKNKSLAGFVHGIVNVTDRFRIIGGARYSMENKKAYFRVGQLQNEGVFDNFVDRKERNFKAFTPKLGVEYEVNDSLFGYASIAKGYSSGGFSPRAGSQRSGRNASGSPQMSGRRWMTHCGKITAAPLGKW